MNTFFTSGIVFMMLITCSGQAWKSDGRRDHGTTTVHSNSSSHHHDQAGRHIRSIR